MERRWDKRWETVTRGKWTVSLIKILNRRSERKYCEMNFIIRFSVPFVLQYLQKKFLFEIPVEN